MDAQDSLSLTAPQAQTLHCTALFSSLTVRDAPRLFESNLKWDEFPLMGKKISLTVLAARLGPLGHKPGFRNFFAAGRSRVAFS